MDRIVERDLYQTELLRIGVKTVSFSVEGNPRGGAHLRQKRRQSFVRVDHAPIYQFTEVRRRIMKNFGLSARGRKAKFQVPSPNLQRSSKSWRAWNFHPMGAPASFRRAFVF